MNTSAAREAGALAIQPAKERARDTDAWLLAGIVFVLVLQLTELFRRGINWDEFHHYNLLWELRGGTLSNPINTVFTRALVWVTELPGDPIDHIIAIRLMMFGFELAILAAIIALAQRFSNRTTGLICALAYISFPFVFGHGYSFRFDPPVTALMLGAAWIIMVRPLDWKTILVAAALIGLSILVTVKIVLLLPAFAGLLWLRWSEHDFAWPYAARIGLVGALALALAGLAYLGHINALPAAPPEQTNNIAGGVGNVMFALEPKPFWGTALLAAIKAPLVALLIALFAIRIGGRPTPEKIALGGMFATITTLVYYLNTAPYFYVFMLPWVLIACCVSIEWMVAKFAPLVVGAAFVASGVIAFASEPASPLKSQRQLILAAQETFPEDLAYFDFMGMLPRQEKANPFMTLLTVKRVQAEGRSIYSETMAERAVPLMMKNHVQFDLLFADPAQEALLPDGTPVFTEDDKEALLDTYVPFWGPFLIAGEVIPSGTAKHTFVIRVPGPYTVSGASVTIGGMRYETGAIIELERGTHEVTGQRNGDTRLVWGRNLQPPAYPPPPRPYAPVW